MILEKDARMKRFLITLALAVLAGAVTYSASSMKTPQKTDSSGHTLTALWAQYEAASKADKPQTEAEVLSKIKETALAERLPVDFYDAATAYVNTVQRRDWKQRDALRARLAEEVKAFDEPIVTFLWMQDYGGASTDELWAYVQAHEKGFQGLHKPFFRNIDGYMGGALKDFIASDREYVLWRMLGRRSYDKIDDDEVYRSLRDLLGDSYPDGAYLEYWRAGRLPETERPDALRDVAGKYAGKAVSLYPREDLLSQEFSSLVEKKASSADFKDLYGRCLAYEKERAAYKGDEAAVAKGCTVVKNLCTRLTDQAVSLGVKDGKIQVLMRNLSRVTATLYDGGSSKAAVLRKWTLDNPTGSFYVWDTVDTALPALGDGSYYIEAVSAKAVSSCAYEQHTLSIATRQDARGLGVYVADYRSGKPLDKVDLKLWKGDRLVLTREGFTLDGFTLLPEKFRTTLAASPRTYYSLTAETGSGTALRSSEKVSARADSYARSTVSSVRCNIYRDRGAYNPGDTLQFKAILFQGHPAEKFEVLPGKKLSIVLSDSEGNEVDRKQLTTNEFGSVSGSFPLPEGRRNGYWSLQVLQGKESRGYAGFRVDEFVLPTFDLVFDPCDRLYLPGDEVTVTGRLESYSGHNLAGARLSVKVENDGVVVSELETVPSSGNTFSFTFPAAERGWYESEVTVLDATGETRSFFHTVYVSDGISVNLDVLNAALGEFRLMDETAPIRPFYFHRYVPSGSSKYLLDGNTLRLKVEAHNAEGEKIPLPVTYALYDPSGLEVQTATADSGTQVDIDLSSCKSGLYKVKASASTRNSSGKEIKAESECSILLVRPGDAVLDGSVRRVFAAGESDIATGAPIRFQIGASDGEEWALVTLFGLDREVLETRKVRLDGVGGKKGSLITVALDYKADYPDAVRLQVFYFKRGESVVFDQEYRRAKTRLSLPLSFNRFTSKALPGAEYTFTLKTDAGVEGLAAVWDKSLDEISANSWSTVSTREVSAASVPLIPSCGHVTGRDGYEGDLAEEEVVAYGSAMMKTATRASVNMMAVMDDSVEMAAETPGSDLGDVAVRSVFSSALTFQPHLRPSSDGTLSFSFRTSDKLSTYYVAVYAHDKALRNALVKDEMQVSLPVKVAVVEPGFLYQGDVYDLSAAVSSIVDTPVSGRLCVYVYDNADGTGEPLSVQQVPVTVGAGETLSRRFRVAVPEVRTLSFKVAFVAPEFSDAVLLPVPVSAPAQTLREAHSAVLRAGADREALLADLRSRFVNVPGQSALLKEITVLDMVKDAIPDKVEPSGHDVLSLSEAWYVRLLSGNLPTDELLEKILACRNADGGFGWFEGMTSSAVITAVLLERMAKLRDRGFCVPDMTSSVKFLDESQLGTEFPIWRGWVSTAQYLHVRALYPAVPFTVNPTTVSGRKRMAEFKKYVKDYLVPSKADGRGLQGQILAKARRIYTLKHLSETSEGLALAKAWGVTFAAKSKLRKSLQADIASLLEYAVEHRDGGWYYPNAVMPWRGLLESEAYAHALLCDLLTETGASEVIPDGIRLWLMLQKETQHWDADPAFIDAITSILDGSEAVLDTRVLALSAEYEAPFREIKAAGNGFTVARKFFREVTVEKVYDDKTSAVNDRVTELREIQPGETVSVGEKIIARYEIWNGENRSFVKLDAAREASLRPVQQLSGLVFRGYRNVKTDRTEFFYESYPEENTTVTEEFFVTQAGTFSAPVVTIESLYAPHYCANDAWRGPLDSK